MINALLDISGKIDEDSAAALAHVKAAADSLGISFFIIGALARDILLKLHFGLPPHRATLDFDLGVSVASWGHFSSLKNELTENHRFKGTNQVQRLQYERILVDIVPFGPIAGPAHTIRWPPDESFQMSTAGFEEAFMFSHQVNVGRRRIRNQEGRYTASGARYGEDIEPKFRAPNFRNPRRRNK